MARTLLVCVTVAYAHNPTPLHAEEPAEAYVEPALSDDARLHWSFIPLQPVSVPELPGRQTETDAVGNSSATGNAIDAFIASDLAALDLQLQPAADRRALIRRLSFDLTGLPPSLAQIDAFLANTDHDAYEQLVKELLESPHYGERWAQHWLDLARFAETDGFEHDKVRADAWKYRDWVIDAFNSDMPYDEFLRQQLAGDELYPDDPAARTATRFCLSGPDMPDINLAEERRHTVLNELTAMVGEVVLGLQVGCAQCHDHKYDPISQADFYRLRAIFEPAVQLKKNKSLSVLQEQVPMKQTSHLMLRGDFRSPGPAVQPGILRVVAKDDYPFAPQAKKHTAGLRTAMADWLVDRDNPLTSRVIVNRLWQHHFGTGLVETPSEFGSMGERPSNARLLDWLANDLIEHRWSLKSLHRQIVTSATYRQRSFLPTDASPSQQAAWQAALTADPQTRMLSRYPRWRLEGEAIRDAMLFTAGRLNLKPNGPSVRPPLPQELVATLLKNQWNETEDRTEHTRRSIYVFARRNLRYPLFEVFDRPSANTSCPQRNESTTAPQSLHLLNSQFSLQMATHLANQIRHQHDAQKEQIEAAFRHTLGRSPAPEEHSEVERFWQQQQKDSATPAEPLTHLCLSLFNCNEFVIVD